MKPRLPKPERKALRFAYDLICGKLKIYYTYTHGLVLHRQGETWNLHPAGWIEPDLDPEQPFLNESTFTYLLMLSYFECKYFAASGKWLYRLTREGCKAMEWEWPNKRSTNQQRRLPPIAQRKLHEEFQHSRNRHSSQYPLFRQHYIDHSHPQLQIYHRLHK